MSLNTTAPTFTASQVVTAADLNVVADGIQAAWTSYTPTISADSGAFTTTSATGRYMRIGKTIHYHVSVAITTAGTASGAVRFTLPVTAHASAAFIGSGREMQSTGAMCFVLTNQAGGATIGAVSKYDNTTVIASSRTVTVSGTYEAA